MITKTGRKSKLDKSNGTQRNIGIKSLYFCNCFESRWYKYFI